MAGFFWRLVFFFFCWIEAGSLDYFTMKFLHFGNLWVLYVRSAFRGKWRYMLSQHTLCSEVSRLIFALVALSILI